MKGPKSTTPNGGTANAPLWRKHFPIDAVADGSQTRREFVGGLAVAGVAIGCGQVALQTLAAGRLTEEKINNFPPLKLDRKLTELADGEALLFHYPDHKSPCLLVKLADDYVAYSQKCTHLACPVIPNVDAARFDCPCHKGTFDLTSGKPTSGPPRAVLPKVIVNLDADGTLTATGIAAT